MQPTGSVPTSGSTTEYRFRGQIVPFRWIRGFWWDRVQADAQQLVFRPWLRKKFVIARSDTAAVRFRLVCIPLWVNVEVTIELTDGTHMRKIFGPLRPGKMKRALVGLGWPVRQLPTAGFSALWASPYS